MDNTGLANGNIINNGNITTEMVQMDNELKIIIAVLTAFPIFAFVKEFIKYIKKEHERNGRLDNIITPVARAQNV